MDNFAKELERDFLDEAFTLVDSLERSLLELEKNPNEANSINEVFRAAHTIKGGAGTVGFDEIQHFTHIMEDVFDLVRKGKLFLSADDISIMLQCRDELSNMLYARENGDVYQSDSIKKLFDALTSLKSKAALETPPVKQPKTDTSSPSISNKDLELSNYDISVIHNLIEDGKTLYILKYKLNENYEMKEVSAFQLHALINDIGEIIKVFPSIDTLEDAFVDEVSFVVSCDKPADFIKDKTYLKEMVRDVSISSLDSKTIGQLEKPTSEETRTEAQTNEILPKAEQKPSDDTDLKQNQSQASDDNGDNVEKRNLSTLRVESWKVDNLMNQLGELVITKSTLSQLQFDFEKHSANIKTCLKEFLSGILKLNLSGESEVVSEKNEILTESLNAVFSMIENYGENIQKLNRISSSLQENVMNMRMVPIQMVFSRFPRLIRDISNKLDKKIDLVIEGVETEIDKGMVDDIFDPLIHILRNAVDHGIEPPEVRKELGKNESGKIVLKAVHEGDSIVIEVSDDGKGIDPEKLREKAIANGIFSAEAAAKMSQREILSLVFLPGFSTATQVSNMSGRGVGMDVVKKKIEEIGGNVGIATVKGKGTRIVIRLPLTLAIIQGLLIVVENMYYVIPVASVEETLILDLRQLKEINGRHAIELREKLIPILPLKRFFYGVPLNKDGEAKEYGIVTKYGDRVVCIIVNKVIGEQDIVIKPLNTKLIKSPGISAATVVGNGNIGYIIDTSQVISHYFKTIA